MRRRRRKGSVRIMRRFIPLSLLSLTFVCIFVTPAMADGPLGWKGSGSGDWNGQRTHLDEDLGLTFFWIGDITAQQNVSGGDSKGGATFARNVLQVNYQFTPLTPLKGSEIQVSAGWSVGTAINDYVGALLSPSGIYHDSAMRLYELYWGQFLADKQVHFKIGRIGLCPFEYASQPFVFDGDISNGHYCNPGGLYLNQPTTAYVMPVATWGARIQVEPKKQDFKIWLAVYNGWPRNLDAADKHGVDFSINLKKSTFVVGEFWYKLNQDPEDHGLPGNYKIGGMYDSGPFTRFDNGETQRRNPGWYVMGDQMLFREKPEVTPTDPAKSKRRSKMSSPAPADQGLSATANFVMNPRKAINIAPYWVAAGLFYKGAIPHRGADVMSFAFYYASLSPESALDFEFQLRFYYSLYITSWIFMSPHVQYFRKPGGGSIKDAVMLGLFFHFTL